MSKNCVTGNNATAHRGTTDAERRMNKHTAFRLTSTENAKTGAMTTTETVANAKPQDLFGKGGRSGRPSVRSGIKRTVQHAGGKSSQSPGRNEGYSSRFKKSAINVSNPKLRTSAAASVDTRYPLKVTSVRESSHSILKNSLPPW